LLALSLYAARRRWPQTLGTRLVFAGAILGLFALLAIACGTTLVNNGTPTSTPPGSYTIRLTGTVGTLTHNVSTGLTVTSASGG
jgi:hypothetical protein